MLCPIRQALHSHTRLASIPARTPRIWRCALARRWFDPDQNRDQRDAQDFSERGRRMKASERTMWQMGTPGSLIFIGLVAAIVALSLKLLGYH